MRTLTVNNVFFLAEIRTLTVNVCYDVYYYVVLKELPGISMCRCLCAGSMCSYVLLCAGSMCGTVFPTIKYGPTWAHMGPCGPIYEISRKQNAFFAEKKAPAGTPTSQG